MKYIATFIKRACVCVNEYSKSGQRREKLVILLTSRRSDVSMNG